MPDDLSAPAARTRLAGQYTGTRAELFRLALVTAALTLATLGLYRFWARTRIRRYVWSATRAGGDVFEYTGTGREKFLGFLMALAVLGAVLGLAQLLIVFLGYRVFDSADGDAGAPVWAWLLNLSALPMVPLYQFAAYRARRYRLSRTRWRGIRFGLEPGAGGYAWRATLCLLAALASGGLLLPLMTFTLEKFRTDRTWFGDAHFRQTGRWPCLYPAMTHYLLGLGVLGLSGAGLALGYPAFLLGLPIGVVWAAIGYLRYRVRSFAILMGLKTLGDGIRFGAAPRTSTVLRHLAVGGVLTVLGAGAISGTALGLLALMGDPPGLQAGVTEVAVSGAGALLTLLLYSSLALVFIRQPIHAHFAATTRIENAAALATICQRTGDAMSDADGFADALDVGAAF